MQPVFAQYADELEQVLAEWSNAELHRIIQYIAGDLRAESQKHIANFCPMVAQNHAAGLKRLLGWTPPGLRPAHFTESTDRSGSKAIHWHMQRGNIPVEKPRQPSRGTCLASMMVGPLKVMGCVAGYGLFEQDLGGVRGAVGPLP